MATTASPPTRATHTTRRSPTSVSPTPQPASSISRGATARSAASPRVSASLNGAAARRASLKGKVSPPPVALNGETRETLSASLKLETEKKEKLIVQIQDKDQTIASLKSENDNLTSTLHAAETRLAELYADQGRMEEEMAARMEVTEKLRTQVRELEKEKRDLQKRYNEQTATFDAERQAFYDNEQHLKSRIQSLSQARRQPLVPTSPSKHSTVDSDGENEEWEITEPQTPQQDMADPEQEPAEMTALRLELSTLSTSYTSLHSTLVLLQSQLVDLKRVNNELQEENESYNILLREKTLSGQFDVMKMGGTSISEVAESSAGGDDDDVEDDGKDAESFRSRATGRSTLDPVDEVAEEHISEIGHGFRSPPSELGSEEMEETSQTRNPRSRHSRKRSSVSAPRGESLANLPITGPGLDLAAELGRAENKDILEGRAALDTDRSVLNPKPRKTKKGSVSESGRKVSGVSEGGVATNTFTDDLDALRSEVKNLKDANKALSLYASKIIDRIISQEGFEHVLAVDYDKLPHPAPSSSSNTGTATKSATSHSTSQKKARPQSAIFSSLTATFGSSSPPQPQIERLTTFDSPNPSSASASPVISSPSSAATAASKRASRRSMSFDWKSFSMFGGNEKKDVTPPHLRPLTLKPGAPPIITGARKLDTQEDEEDRKERERLNATMKLMGIEKPPNTPILGTPAAPIIKSISTPVQTVSPELPAVMTTSSTPVTATAPNRFSAFFRRSNSIVNSDSSSPHPSGSGTSTPNLTQEVLEQAEAESAIAALDAHERQLSAELAKGGGSGFTEITPRRSGDRRSSRKSGGSGGTVWSAGMSKEDD